MVTFAGVDHVSFTVTDPDVSQRFYVEVLDFVPVLDVGYGRILMHGFHLNFRDPDGIALELSAPNEHLVAAKEALAGGQTSQADIDAFIEEHDLDLPGAD
jgi:catechol 2,3-dioxygenase-like lactoylglutathione lyase family enzyme